MAWPITSGQSSPSLERTFWTWGADCRSGKARHSAMRTARWSSCEGRSWGCWSFPMEVDEGYVETDPVLAPHSVLEEDQSYYV